VSSILIACMLLKSVLKMSEISLSLSLSLSLSISFSLSHTHTNCIHKDLDSLSPLRLLRVLVCVLFIKILTLEDPFKALLKF